MELLPEALQTTHSLCPHRGTLRERGGGGAQSNFILCALMIFCAPPFPPFPIFRVGWPVRAPTRRRTQAHFGRLVLPAVIAWARGSTDRPGAIPAGGCRQGVRNTFRHPLVPQTPLRGARGPRGRGPPGVSVFVPQGTLHSTATAGRGPGKAAGGDHMPTRRPRAYSAPTCGRTPPRVARGGRRVLRHRPRPSGGGAGLRPSAC